jgi:hypothetical protein
MSQPSFSKRLTSLKSSAVGQGVELPRRTSFGKNAELQSIDLLEVRRQLIALRLLHSHEPRATTLINRVLAKIAHLHEPESKAHEKRLQNLIAKTIRNVQKIAFHRPHGVVSDDQPDAGEGQVGRLEWRTAD